MDTNQFKNLRALARERRDKAIADIRTDYETVLVQIAKLEQQLSGMVTARQRKVCAAIDSVLPVGKSFTTADIMAALRVIDPQRDWSQRAIDSHISRLRLKGILKRLRRSTVDSRAVYARVDFNAEPESKSLREHIAAVLVRPMTMAEIAVAVLEAGCKTTMKGRCLRNTIARELREGGYKRDGERWSSR